MVGAFVVVCCDEADETGASTASTCAFRRSSQHIDLLLTAVGLARAWVFRVTSCCRNAETHTPEPGRAAGVGASADRDPSA